MHNADALESGQLPRTCHARSTLVISVSMIYCERVGWLDSVVHLHHCAAAAAMLQLL